MPIRTVPHSLTSVVLGSFAAYARRAALAVVALVAIASAAQADYAAGLDAFNRKDFAHAFSEWIESAKAGDAHAQHGLGMLYELGQGVPNADPKAAADWYQKAAAQNYAPALNNLARLYADGRGVAQNLPKAIELWSRAAEAGNATARFNLGVQYANGSGVKKDVNKAADYLLKAAESGLPEAQFAVASLYRDGTGVEKDLDAARQWFDRAATAGYEPARKELAALDKAAVSSAPAVGNSESASTPPGEPAQVQKTDTPPPQPESAEGKPAEKPAEGQSQEAAAQQQTPPPPADEAKQPDTTETPKLPTEASTTQPPKQDEAAPKEDEAKSDAEEQPGEEGSVATNTPNPGSDLPIAESLTGDARIYRIWLYESGQEGDAKSYWEKLNQQYPGLLKKLKLDLRRYFLGEAKGSLYRVFAGPFDDLGAAQKACEDIKTRFGDQFCRPVLN
jgi:hypothetical protein